MDGMRCYGSTTGAPVSAPSQQASSRPCGSTRTATSTPRSSTPTATPWWRARAAGVAQLVLPAVEVAHFAALRALARSHTASPTRSASTRSTCSAADEDLARLDAELAAQRDDPLLVAVGEIGLDHFVPGLTASARSASTSSS